MLVKCPRATDNHPDCAPRGQVRPNLLERGGLALLRRVHGLLLWPLCVQQHLLTDTAPESRHSHPECECELGCQGSIVLSKTLPVQPRWVRIDSERRVVTVMGKAHEDNCSACGRGASQVLSHFTSDPLQKLAIIIVVNLRIDSVLAPQLHSHPDCGCPRKHRVESHVGASGVCVCISGYTMGVPKHSLYSTQPRPYFPFFSIAI